MGDSNEKTAPRNGRRPSFVNRKSESRIPTAGHAAVHLYASSPGYLIRVELASAARAASGIPLARTFYSSSSSVSYWQHPATSEIDADPATFDHSATSLIVARTYNLYKSEDHLPIV